MTIFLSGNDAAELANKVSPYGGKFLPEDTVACVYQVDGEVRCVVILNHWESSSVEGTVISSGKFVSRKFIRDVYDFIFNNQDRKLLLMWTSIENGEMISIHQKFGHRISGMAQNKFGDETGVLWSMTKTQWKENSKFV